MKNKDVKEIEIDLRKILKKLQSKLVWIIVTTIVFGIVAGVGTHLFIKPQYSSTIKMYVYSNSDRVTTNSTITQNELTASQDLVNTYIYILESDTALEEVIKDLNLKMTPGQLRGMITANKAADTVAFEVTVTCSSPKWSAKIANSIAKVAPAEIIRVVKAGGVEIIDYAKEPKSPSSPNLKKNVLIGAIIGLLLSFGFAFIYALFDSSISSAKDLEKEFNYPILGSIPKLGTVDKTNTDYSNKSTPKAIAPPEPRLQPSDSVINNIKAMKGDE